MNIARDVEVPFFAKKYNLKTATDEVMIQDEYLKFASDI